MTCNIHDRAEVLIEQAGNLTTAILMLRNILEERIRATNSKEFEGEVIASLEKMAEILISIRSMLGDQYDR